jgi:hypothetical protein
MLGGITAIALAIQATYQYATAIYTQKISWTTTAKYPD